MRLEEVTLRRGWDGLKMDDLLVCRARPGGHRAIVIRITIFSGLINGTRHPWPKRPAGRSRGFILVPGGPVAVFRLSQCPGLAVPAGTLCASVVIEIRPIPGQNPCKAQSQKVMCPGHMSSLSADLGPRIGRFATRLARCMPGASTGLLSSPKALAKLAVSALVPLPFLRKEGASRTAARSSKQSKQLSNRCLRPSDIQASRRDI